MHFCADEMCALMAALPVLPYVVSKIKALIPKRRGVVKP